MGRSVSKLLILSTRWSWLLQCLRDGLRVGCKRVGKPQSGLAWFVGVVLPCSWFGGLSFGLFLWISRLQSLVDLVLYGVQVASASPTVSVGKKFEKRPVWGFFLLVCFCG